MSVIGGLLEAIRGKRKEKFASKAAEYDSFVVALSRGDEVDVDTLAELLDELDLSDSDLESDVKAKQRRHEIALQIRSMESTEKQLEKNERELQKLNSEIERFLAERKPKVLELSQTVRLQQAEVGAKNSLIHDLQFGPTVARHLAQKRQELTSRRKVWGSKLREYEDATAQPRTMVRQLAGRIEVLDGKITKADSADAALLRGQRSQVEAEQRRYQDAIDGLAADKAALDAELALIEKEERALNAELLQP